MRDSDYPELGVVRIASPCSESWAKMSGDARVRHCAKCQLKVFNFAELSSEEARQLLRQSAEGGRICARIYRRFDGTVLTRDCPVGLRAGWRWARKLLPGAKGLALVSVALLAVGLVVITLFGDNIRRLFATEAGGMMGSAEVDQPRTAQELHPRKLASFGKDNTY